MEKIIKFVFGRFAKLSIRFGFWLNDRCNFELDENGEKVIDYSAYAAAQKICLHEETITLCISCGFNLGGSIHIKDQDELT